MIEKFELTIDIEGLIEETDKACFFLSLVSKKCFDLLHKRSKCSEAALVVLVIHFTFAKAGGGIGRGSLKDS